MSTTTLRAAAVAALLLTPTVSQASYTAFSDNGTAVSVSSGADSGYSFSPSSISTSSSTANITWTMTNQAGAFSPYAYDFVANTTLVAEFDFSQSGGTETIVYNDFAAQGLFPAASSATGTIVTMALSGDNYVAGTVYWNGANFEGYINLVSVPASEVPEPASLAVIGFGAAVLGIARRRRAR